MRDTSTESANDWVEWKGGCCPVAAETRVEVKLRDNSTHQNDADAVRWSHTVNHRQKRHRDVVAYRVLPAETALRPPLGGLRFILRRQTKDPHSGMETCDLSTMLAHVPELEAMLRSGGYGNGGYDITELVGVELVPDNRT